jgi:hypothetical protein
MSQKKNEAVEKKKPDAEKEREPPGNCRWVPSHESIRWGVSEWVLSHSAWT